MRLGLFFHGFDEGEVVEGAEDVEDAGGEEDAPVGEVHGAEGLEDAGGKPPGTAPDGAAAGADEFAIALADVVHGEFADGWASHAHERLAEDEAGYGDGDGGPRAAPKLGEAEEKQQDYGDELHADDGAAPAEAAADCGDEEPGAEHEDVAERGVGGVIGRGKVVNVAEEEVHELDAEAGTGGDDQAGDEGAKEDGDVFFIEMEPVLVGALGGWGIG